MKLSQIASQLYTLSDFCKTAPEVAATAQKVRAIGYEAVQISGVGPIPEAELVKIFQGEGLTICATHEPSDQVLNEPERVIERLHKLGCKLTAYPYPKDIDFASKAHIEALISKLDAAGANLRAAGLALGYHNHGIEFVKHESKPVLEHISDRTDPANLVAELDTYWIHYGDGDVVEWTQRVAGRQPFIHLKDYGFTPANTHQFCEIGAGTLPFDRIIAGAERGGCQWFIVEQDRCPGDPFDSIRQSFDHINSNLVA